MAGTLIAQRIRLLLDAQKWNQPQLTELLTADVPVIAAGADLQFELELQDGAGVLLDYTNVASVVVQLSANTSPRNNNIIYTASLAVANIKTTCSLSDFNGYVGLLQAVLIVIPNAQTQIALSGPSAVYWLTVYATSTDPTAKDRPILSAPIQVVDAGLPTPAPSLTQAMKVGGKLPFVCSPANGGDGLTRDLTIGPGPMAGQWVTKINQAGYNGPGQVAYSFYCDPAAGGDGLFRDLTLQLQDGYYTLAINQNGHS